MQSLFSKATTYVVRNRHHRTWMKVVTCLACIVVFCTTYALILPAITLENKTTYCGYEEHEHDDSCYTQELICGYEAGEGAHTHSADCYDSEGNLLCDVEESEGHVHTDACYSERKVTCGQEAHTHQPECYINPDPDLETTGDEKTTPPENPDTEVEETEADTDEQTSSLAVDENGFKTLNLTDTTSVNEFYLWLWAYMGDMDNHSDGIKIDGRSITDARTYSDEGQTYHLIPVSYFTENYGKYGYTFSEDTIATSDSPFFYAPNAYTSTEGLTPASYVYVQDDTNADETKTGWYVEIQDTTGLPTARSNIYYYVPEGTLIEVNNFKLWLWEGSKRATTAAEKVFNSDSADDGMITVLQRAGSNSYLIPIDIFKEHLSSKYYTFDEEAENTDCPFYYAPNAEYSKDNLTLASYIYVQDDTNADETKAGWYVEIQDTGTYNGPRSNVYYYYDDTKYSPLENTVNHPGSIINLFDYWTTSKEDSDYGTNNFTSGINQNHALKFSEGRTDSSQNTDGLWNVWTGNKTVRQGIVANTLGNDGYPALSNNSSVFIPDVTTLTNVENSVSLTESLAYLFDPTKKNDSKETHRNVSGLLQVDAQGYYYYDSSENFAEYHEDTNSFTLYDTWGVLTGGSSPNGQFFPFNSMEKVANVKSTDLSINHYFGMTLTTRFVQQYSGHTNASHKTDTVFNFAGDDDVWIFIDDVLVADLGGIHDRASVSINFATGEVNINDNSDQSTTLKAAFSAANKKPIGGWDGNTFADNTYHTLKFYYLERGNTDSNLWLQYNLSPYPESGIYKVNQYGDPVPGATFAVYAADEHYNMLDKLNGNLVQSSANNTYDLNPSSSNYGSIMNGNTVVAKALYTGTTDQTGEMVFVDEDEMPYTLTELENMFGAHFILKEIAVPEGYRQVSDEVQLRIVNHQVMLCDNTFESGIYAAANLQVVAPNTIMLADPGSGKALPSEGTYIGTVEDANGKTRTTVDYYNADGHVNGTVFAVVLKYTGTSPDDLRRQQSWAPVYGTDEEGFTVVDVQGDYNNDFIKAAIETAQKYKESNTEFTLAGGQMQGDIKGMPGDISTYYYMLDANKKGETQYTIAYYWSKASSLKEATSANTWRIDADKETAGQSYAFNRRFGATIAVPNLLNRLFVQKLDEDGSLVNGAKFAMYDVEEVENDDTSENTTTIYYRADDKTLIYLAPDTDGDNAGAATVKGSTAQGTYKVDSNTGVITVTIPDGEPASYTISPEPYAMEGGDVATTQPAGDEKKNPSGEDGTATFTNMESNTYYVREIAAPAGYAINPTEVMVLVDENAVYANAGTADDGVTVARGPGYVVSTLDQFASQGDIDNTLTWIYEMMRVSDVSTTFKDSDFSDGPPSNWGYLTENKNGTKLASGADTDNALKTYLKYEVDSHNTLFNYTVNTERGTGGTQRRMYTNVGWTYYEIYQDWRWALGDGNISSHLNTGANYTILTNNGETTGSLLEIANLFSRSTYIQVTDQKTAGDLEISKTVEDAPENDTTQFEFTVTLKDAQGTELTGNYDYTIFNVDEDGSRTEAKDEQGNSITGTISGSGTITLTDRQIVIIKNLPAGTQYTITETTDARFSTTAEEKVVSPESSEDSEGPPYWKSYTFSAEDARTVTGSLYWYVDEENGADTTSVVNYTNTYLPGLTILKVDATDSDTKLEGAEFVLYKTITGEEGTTITKYYDEGNWVELSTDETDENPITLKTVSQTTNENGIITYSSIPDGTYYLKELTAPDGYNLLEKDIEIQVKNGKIASAQAGTTSYTPKDDEAPLTLKVPNNTGVTLPNTGGEGTSFYTYSGLLLTAGAIVCGYALRRKRERRTID